MDSLNIFAREKLSVLEAGDLRRTLTPTRRIDGVRVERGGRELISFSCNDYLGLAQDPRVKAAAIAAVERYGTGAGASRLVTGEHPLLGRLETALARHKGAEAALVFGSGYLANIGITPALVGRGDLVLLDSLSHACMFAGARLSGAEVATFRHNDLEDLAAQLAARRGGAARAMVLTERVFSMDGDRAPVGEMNALAASRRLADGGRRPRAGRDRARGLRAAGDGHSVQGAGQLRRLSVRLRPGGGAVEEPGAQFRLHHRSAAGGGRCGGGGARYSGGRA
jgi:8-amino-7-oxononanoate synthase